VCVKRIGLFKIKMLLNTSGNLEFEKKRFSGKKTRGVQLREFGGRKTESRRNESECPINGRTESCCCQCKSPRRNKKLQLHLWMVVTKSNLKC
jgi:hypothetical protein